VSHIRQHKNILKKAYNLISPKINGYFFPKYKNIRKYDTILSPDTIHAFRFIKGYEKYNHLNTLKHPQGVGFAIKFYEKLVQSLKKRSPSARNASWLSHFIVDSLEPANLVEWRGLGRKESKNKLACHVWIEKASVKLEVDVKDVAWTRGGMTLREYIEDKSCELRNLKLFELYPKEREEILDVYREKIIPLQIKSVSRFWYNAILEAN
jgi:hypothetical protein